ncbi:MAG: 16S rRNA (adenine(1518)-N(6)/adenine(1519)-N(6))-dimethyltransferase RsmA [Candidatus Saelkia tenebricola]|nr:16S rRNA (adenine(1518)-N(6)/adenine(1519)-N(6))-dimethyltransferase RsmA [Candidatus Saelkia tenebricola]
MQVKKVLREFNIRPKKRLGQNFLISQHHLEKIMKVTNLSRNDVVLEIGPGVGNLTELLLENTKKVISVEKDEVLVEVLNQIFQSNKKLKIIKGDFLNINLRKIYKTEKKLLKVIANPPYYISTQIIEKLINERKYYKTAFLSFQKEYVQRMLATPATKNYGRLTIFTQVYLNVEFLFKIPKSVFYPVPVVDSMFISIRPKKVTKVKNENGLHIVTREFFCKRRKKISTILKNSSMLPTVKINRSLSDLNIDPNSRPEELSVSDYINIANSLN